MKNTIKTLIILKSIKILVVILSLFLMTGTANAAKDYTIKEIEQYLSSFRSFSAKFDQVIPGEGYSKGEVFIQKPGKFLWQYLAPDRVKIISNGGLVYFQDKENGQLTQIPSSGFLFALLSRDDISFTAHDIMIQEFKQTKNRITIHLTAKVEKKKVPVSLIFEKKAGKSLRLMKIISVNQLDQTMIISLYDQNDNAKINPNIFRIDAEENDYRN